MVQPSIDIEELYGLYAARLRAWAKRRGVPASDCDDLIQEIFLQAHRGHALFRGESTPISWLFQIAKRVIVKTWRRRLLCPLPYSDDIFDEMQSEGISPLENAELCELTRRLDRALTLAGAECRRLILANALGGPIDADDAADGSLKAGTRWVRLHRARRRLMAILLRSQQDAYEYRTSVNHGRRAAARAHSGPEPSRTPEPDAVHNPIAAQDHLQALPPVGKL